MSAERPAPALAHPSLLALVDAVKVADVEFSDWCITTPAGGDVVFGHIQLAHRRAVTRVLDALLGLDARLDLDVGPSTKDAQGRWSVWVRAHRQREPGHPR